VKKIVLIPKRLHPSRFSYMRDLVGGCLGGQCFYELLRDELGFELIYANSISDIPSDTGIVWCIFRNNFFGDIAKLKKNVKLILSFGDIHGGHREWILSHSDAINRADVVISLSQGTEYLVEKCEGLSKKLVYFRKCFQPHDRFVKLPFNKNPKMKCLVTGRFESRTYPLRTSVMNHVIKLKKAGEEAGKLIDVNAHYWYDRKKEKNPFMLDSVCGDRYAKRLNEYFCSTGLSGVQNYLLGKIVEIPAAGSLLITQEVPEMKARGFVPWEHYVPVNKPSSSVIDQIVDVLRCPGDFEGIRMNGMKFVRENFSIRNRLEKTKKILGQL